MNLSNDLIAQFVKMNKDDTKKPAEATVYGTVVEHEEELFVQLDGSDVITPVTSTVKMKSGERVIVRIKDHSATVTGNVTTQSARTDDVDEIAGDVDNLADEITEVEILIADKVSTEELDAERARIDELVAENVTITERLTANEAVISELEADNVTINEKLTAQEAEIEHLTTGKLDAEFAEITYATIADLEATNATINNLDATYGDFKVLTTDKFEAIEASIQTLDAEKVSAEDLEATYANIDFSNISELAMENFYAKSGLIENVEIGDATISGTLVGVTIKGDLIEGGTIVADKLVIKGEDGLYYKLNTDGETIETKQTEYNSISGSVITAQSITASKISVDDLVAFDATIGGFKITDSSLYSGVKESADNTTRGVFLGDDGQVAFGDASNFVKYYKDAEGNYKLEVSASSISFGASGKTIEETVTIAVDEAIEDIEVKDGESCYFHIRYSANANGNPMTEVPDDNTKYMGTCSTNTSTPPTSYSDYTWTQCRGNDGKDGANGTPGEPGEDGKTQYLHIKYSDDGKTFTGNIAPTDFSVWLTGYYTDVEVENADRIYYPEMISVTAGQKYKISTGSKGGYGYTYYDADGNYITALGSPAQTTTITIRSDAAFVRLWISEVGSYESAETAFTNGEIVPEFYPIDTVLGEELGAYIGTFVDFTEADSEVFSDYTWKKFTEDVDDALTDIRQTIQEQNTSIVSTCESIILEALSTYVKTGDYEEFRQTVESELQVMADEISMNFTQTTEQVTEVDGELQSTIETINKYFEFTVDGLAIKAGEGVMNLTLDNDIIIFKKNGQQFGWWDGIDFHTGNIVVDLNERAQFGNFAFVPRSDGSLSFLKVASIVALKIVQQPTSQTVSLNETVTLSVVAQGVNLSYLWQSSNDNETWNDDIEWTSSSISFTETSDTTMYYRCVVTDGDGNSIISDVATITVIS